jgi:hypothetical protein
MAVSFKHTPDAQSSAQLQQLFVFVGGVNQHSVA